MATHRSTKKRDDAPLIALEEWDFTDCPDEEVEHCAYYEYSRESEKTKAYVAELRANGNWNSGLYPGDAEYYERSWFLNFFKVFEEFPSLPWLKIEKSSRENRSAKCRKLEGPFLEVGPERLINEEEEYPFHPNDRGVWSLPSVYAFEIEWTASDDAIKKSFARWLAQARPFKEAVQKKSGQLSPRELLKYLGAFRLLRAYGGDWDAAQACVVEHGIGSPWTPSYSDERAWRRATQKAKCKIEHGIVFTPAARLMKALDRAGLSSLEKARAKWRVAQMDRAEKRKLTKLKADEFLAEIERLMKAEMGAQKQLG